MRLKIPSILDDEFWHNEAAQIGLGSVAVQSVWVAPACQARLARNHRRAAR